MDTGISKGNDAGLIWGVERDLSQGLYRGTFNKSGDEKEWEPELRAWLGQLTNTPSLWYRTALNNLIRGLKADNIWWNLDRMWIFATEYQDNARVSIVNPKGLDAAWPTNITEVNSPTWKAYKGYTGNGSTTYLNSNYIPLTQAINFQLNNNSFGTYTLTQTATGVDYGLIGTMYSGGGGDYIIPNYTGGEYIATNNSTFFTATGTGSNKTTGLQSVLRNNSTNAHFYWNGIDSLGAISTTSSGLSIPNVSCYLLAINSTGTTIHYAANTISMAYIGAAIDQYSMYQRFQIFAKIIGFAV